KKIIAWHTGVDGEQVTRQASFVEDLNADSLDLVELIMSLEEEFGMEISDEDAEQIQKVSCPAESTEEHRQYPSAPDGCPESRRSARPTRDPPAQTGRHPAGVRAQL